MDKASILMNSVANAHSNRDAEWNRIQRNQRIHSFFLCKDRPLFTNAIVRLHWGKSYKIDA